MRAERLYCVAAGLLALVFAVGSADASSIGIFFTADGNDCDATPAPYTPLAWYVLAHTYGGDLEGITGAEFRVANVPATWFHTITANPAANTVLGNLFTGTSVAFPACQPGPWVLLYSVSTFPTAPVTAPMTWQVMAHSSPSSPNFNCPLLVDCDRPYYFKHCVSGGEAFLDGRPCTVGVEPTAWSEVKEFYR